jgi:hypothetical protein
MSSHREAPEISKDPAADNTDVYAFVDALDPTKVNLIANFNPFELPYGGPNFNEFADDVLYTINVSNSGTSEADISFQFRFRTVIRNPNTFLYNTFPITSIDSPTWNRPQYFSVTKVVRAADGTLTSTVLGTDLLVPPCNVGERSTPNYEATFGTAAVQALGAGRQVFAGPRADAFFVDLGSIFDLGGIRGLNANHLLKLPVVDAMNGLQGLNIHAIALQVPLVELAVGGTKPDDPAVPTSVIGVWSSTFRTRGRLFDSTTGKYRPFGEPVQVSRLGNPLFNEVITPMAQKDRWNAAAPSGDSTYAPSVARPELAQLLPVLYPGVFPNLEVFNASGQPRADLDAILLTGIPAGVVSDTYSTLTSAVKADMLRLNLAIAPRATGEENIFGILGGDVAGFPNGRRLRDDVTGIELQALAGATIGLVYDGYVADGAATGLADGTTNTNPALLDRFPYLGTPNSGYSTSPPQASSGGTPAQSAGQPAAATRRPDPTTEVAPTSPSAPAVVAGVPAARTAEPKKRASRKKAAGKKKRGRSARSVTGSR